jgi:hypothetical protein
MRRNRERIVRINGRVDGIARYQTFGASMYSGQPLRALLTAAINSLISTPPLPEASNAGQRSSGRVPSAMFTPMMSSLIEMSQLPSQSPTHAAVAGVLVGVGTVMVVGARRAGRRSARNSDTQHRGDRTSR